MANVLSISLTYTRPVPGPGGPVLYRIATGIGLGDEVSRFLPYWDSGDVTVAVPPHRYPFIYNINVSPVDDGYISLKVSLNGKAAFSGSFRLNEFFQETTSVAFLDGELTISGCRADEFQSL